jgi:hypothetical protein
MSQSRPDLLFGASGQFVVAVFLLFGKPSLRKTKIYVAFCMVSAEGAGVVAHAKAAGRPAGLVVEDLDVAAADQAGAAMACARRITHAHAPVVLDVGQEFEHGRDLLLVALEPGLADHIASVGVAMGIEINPCFFTSSYLVTKDHSA